MFRTVWMMVLLGGCAGAQFRSPASSPSPSPSPSPAPSPSPSPTPSPTTTTTSVVDELRAMVGDRTKETGWEFAARVVKGFGGKLPAEIPRTARFRGTPMTGDLAEFSEIVGIVVGVAASGAVEFVYADRGVVRRGFVAVTTPNDRRDGQGRVLNTHVRPQKKTDGKGQKYLAGELFVSWIRLTAL